MVIQARAWLRSYDQTWLRADVVAGVTLAAYVLPATIGDASLAGLPAQARLYACLFSGLAFWLFCSSRLTVVSVMSAISLLIGATLATMDGGDPARHETTAACTALMVAAIGFADIVRHPEKERVPGVRAVRTEGALVYFNVDHVRDRIAELLAASAPPPRLVIMTMAAVPLLDLAGSELVFPTSADALLFFTQVRYNLP